MKEAGGGGELKWHRQIYKQSACVCWIIQVSPSDFEQEGWEGVSAKTPTLQKLWTAIARDVIMLVELSACERHLLVSDTLFVMLYCNIA